MHAVTELHNRHVASQQNLPAVQLGNNTPRARAPRDS
jgi:hypothetical protein